MKIERFIGGSVAVDGGTIACCAALEDGSLLDLGLDARIPKTMAQRQVFVGAGYPTHSGVRILERGSSEEQSIIATIQEYIDRAIGPERRDTLMEAIPQMLSERDRGDLMALMLMRAISER